jgi:hypothetical protein
MEFIEIPVPEDAVWDEDDMQEYMEWADSVDV